MKIFFAGSGRFAELVPNLLKHPNKNWGVLLSFKDVQTKDGEGNKRFKNLKKTIKIWLKIKLEKEK